MNVSRGMLESRADPKSSYHNPVFDPSKTVILYCASGGRSALAAKRQGNRIQGHAQPGGLQGLGGERRRRGACLMAGAQTRSPSRHQSWTFTVLDVSAPLRRRAPGFLDSLYDSCRSFPRHWKRSPLR